MTTIRWLHLTDIHYGQKDTPQRPEVEERFFKDLERLLPEHPIDLVLCTGDLVFSGQPSEFEAMEAFLGRLESRLDKYCPQRPPILAVPGNHDLARLNFSVAKQWLDKPNIFRTVPREKLYDTIQETFAGYQMWWETRLTRLTGHKRGHLTGDFSWFFEKEGLRLGLLGLNTAFLHQADMKPGELGLHRDQLEQACGNFYNWKKQTDFWLFLTHHPLSWIEPGLRVEIHDALREGDSNGIHLCGHLHKSDLTLDSAHGESVWIGESLFGMEEDHRLHGYSIGKIETSDAGHLRMAMIPRTLVKKLDRKSHFEIDQRLTDVSKPFYTFPSFGRPSPPPITPAGYRVEDDYKLLCGVNTYEQIRDGFDKRAGKPPTKESLEAATIFYLSSCPSLTASSEHLLLVLRRRVNSELRNLAEDDRAAFVSLLQEPAFTDIIVGESNSTKKEQDVLLEVACLLSEIGEQQCSLQLFDRVIELSSTIGAPTLGFLAKDGKAVALQNIGVFEAARTIIDQLLSDPSIGNPDLSYFVYKHAATLMRRLGNNAKAHEYLNLVVKAHEYLNLAARAHNTYHIHYSRGFLYLLEGEHMLAKEQFQSCLHLLGRQHDEEYYLVHLPIALCWLAELPKNIGEWEQPQWQKRVNDVRNQLEKATRAHARYSNFKQPQSELVSLLVRLLLERQAGGVNRGKQKEAVEEHIRAPELLDSNEKVVALGADIKILEPYYSEGWHAVIKPVLDAIDTAKRRFEDLKVLNVKDDPPNPHYWDPKKGLLVCIRYSAWETLTVDNAVNDLEALKKQVRIYLANDFDFVALRGSAFLLAKSLDTNTGITELLKSLFQKVALLSRELSPRRIGIGVACGEYADVLWGQRMLFGPVVSRAEELSRLAVPQGVVISAAEGMPDLTVELAQVITLRTVYWHDKLTEKAYCSSDVVQSKPARYFYQHQNDERRYFINFGRRCHRKCIYCMTRNVPMDCESFDADLFRRELAGVVASGRGDDYLFSLGYLNEPLEKGHFENALCIVRALLARTTGVVQIATKCSPKRIRDFLNCLTIDERRRVTIMYSVSTLKYADHIEPQREEFSVTEREELIGLKNEGYAVMPYVKPFLPGLTDDDEELEEFLLKFSKIVVGYPYLSREVSHQIARICIAENKKALKYYSHARLDELRSSLPLEAPCVANVEYHSADFQKELEVFVQRLESKKKEVFISSPCAVADRYSTTCYTSVGRGDKPFHQQLCREQCSNTGCIYRKRIAHDRTDLIAFVKGELRQRRHLCRDRSHAYDHFIRVHELAQHILAEHAKMLEGKGIKLEDVFTDQDKLVLELSCLVHDLGDPKLSTSPFQQDEEDLRSVAAESFLQTVKRTFGMPNEVVISQVKLVVAKCSFSDYVKDHDIRENIHGTSHLQLRGVDLSGRILFDADLMDAMGAVGVARCFAFPKNKGILDPREPFRSLDELKSVPGYRCAITHFFEKLLRLRTLLMPASLQVMGDRHEKLMSYLVSFLREASVGLDQNERDDLRRNIEAYMGSNGLASSEDWQMLVHAVGAVSPSARGEA